ncbi:MAG: prepilin-type N-terminal cleavage/methylation domain-containing protein [Acidimicrobiia bacterium]|nr:prepilin-type N-terminal cleavage/methylation domain-containing protein [Acidimicrobiia bacterium]MDH5615850.1 prepilin-type N-terminal cleavage/methylation domain-containing protein [Acidimicrobiia bacterium]
MKKISDRLRREDGFTLVEALAALSLLSIAIILTVTPVLAGFGVLSDAKLATIASNLAQGRVEELRSLDYEEIGFPLGVPEGILQASETVTAQSIDFIVTTEVKYFGSVNGPGENVIPQGGDGVEGLPDLGIDFKEVTVTVSHHAGAIRPVVMQTIVAPPNIAAHEGKANVIVELIKEEPASKTASPVGYPQVFLVRDTSPFIPFGGTLAASQTFAGVPASGTGVTDYYYHARLGATLTSYEAASGWRIHPIDIDIETDRVHMGPTETATVPLRIYRPAEIEVRLFDDATSLPITGNATLILDYDGGGSATFTQASSEWDGSGWLVTDLDGAPVVPGTFTFNASAFGYLAQTDADVVVPVDYPLDPHHVQTFNLEPASGSQVILTVTDEVGNPVAGADVTFSDFLPLGGSPITIQTDLNGVASYFFDDSVDAIDWIVESGFHDPSAKNHLNLNDPVEYLNVALDTPATSGLITFHGNIGWVQYFHYRPAEGAPDDWIDVYPNASGEASVTVNPGSWDVEKVCVKLRGNGNPWTRSSTINVAANGNVFWSSSIPSTCPAP